ncbi:hypothetical protein DPMN_008260 [Dreissena polymorpha]|uniref:Uncharacterized protein n=1 Tax=Dreissena polymorpha TaxID=45954 RepID=A0A9D4RWR3_DREPO|nr:hypothetical protein DPMN_008260 [Dreissena polymorpha]
MTCMPSSRKSDPRGNYLGVPQRGYDAVILLQTPVLGVFGEDLKSAPTVGIEPVTSRSLGGHHIHYTTATTVDCTG